MSAKREREGFDEVTAGVVGSIGNKIALLALLGAKLATKKDIPVFDLEKVADTCWEIIRAVNLEKGRRGIGK